MNDDQEVRIRCKLCDDDHGTYDCGLLDEWRYADEWAGEAQRAIDDWRHCASADIDVDLVKAVATIAIEWIWEVLATDLRACYSYGWTHVEEVPFLISPAEVRVGPLVAAGWLIGDPEGEDFFRLSRPQ
jgi:hypothetical protein